MSILLARLLSPTASGWAGSTIRGAEMLIALLGDGTCLGIEVDSVSIVSVYDRSNVKSVEINIYIVYVDILTLLALTISHFKIEKLHLQPSENVLTWQ